jgi:hypothetical protein
LTDDLRQGLKSLLFGPLVAMLVKSDDDKAASCTGDRSRGDQLSADQLGYRLLDQP